MPHGAAKRPFWMHQLVEYIFGVGLVALGTQSPTPVVPAVTGIVLMFYAAITKGALSAFNVLPRGVHRWLDPVMALLIIIAGAQPWADVEFTARFAMFGMAAVYLFVWWQSSYDEKERKPKRATSSAPVADPVPTADDRAAAAAATATSGPTPRASGDRATDIGCTAGRVVGTGVSMFRKARAKSKEQD